MSDWGQGAVNNTIGWGQGAKNNNLNWGESEKTSWSGDTNISGIGGGGFSDVSSFAYDGVDDKLQASSTWDALDGNINTTALTISLWVKLNTLGGTLWRSWDNGGSVQTSITVNSTGMVQTFIGGSGSNWSRSTVNITAGQWVHIVMRYDNSIFSRYEKSQVFINGVRGNTSNFFGGTAPNGFGASIGADGYSNTGHVDGNINEVAIWPQYALTNAEIATIYNNGKPTNLEETAGLSRIPSNWIRSENGTWNGREYVVENYDNAASEQWLSYNMAQDAKQNDVPQQFTNTQSVELDGVDDSISIGATPLNLRFNRLDTFSISAWVKVDTSQNHVILSNQLAPSTNYRGYYFAINASNQLVVILRSTLSDRLFFVSTNTLTNGTWHHVSMTYDGSATTTGVGIYIDSVLSSFSTQTGTLTGTMESTDTLFIGCRSNADNFFSGKIDETAIFNYELTQQQINYIYTNGVKDIAILNPLSLWRFEDAGTTATDSGSGNNNGTLTNGAGYSNDVPT